MIIDERAAKKMIAKLLENDVFYYSKWLDEIKKFNSEQIVNLLDGNKNFDYPIQKDRIGDLIMKFDNFKILTNNWYNKEDYYQYLIPLWKNYICIESLGKLNENKRAEYLESKSIKFSEWPIEVKNEFNLLISNLRDSEVFINKNRFNKRSAIKELINSLDKVKNSFIINDEKSSNLKTKFEKNMKKISDQLLNKLLKYLGPLGPIYGIIEASNKNNNKEETLLKNDMNWLPESDDDDSDYDSKNNSNDSAEVNIEKIFDNKFVFTIYATLTVINLGESIENFKKIHDKIEEIKNNNHEEKINQIVKQFNEHLEKIGDEDFNCNLEQIDGLIQKIENIIKNIENAQLLLIKELEKIKLEIEYLSEKKEESKEGLAKAIFFGAVGIAGCVFSGGMTLGYGISTIANACSIALNGINIYDCKKIIEKNEKLVKRINEENVKFTESIETLKLKLNNKLITIPDYLDNIEQLLQNHNNQ